MITTEKKRVIINFSTMTNFQMVYTSMTEKEQPSVTQIW